MSSGTIRRAAPLPPNLLSTPKSSWTPLQTIYHDWLVHIKQHVSQGPEYRPATKTLAGLRLYTQTGDSEAQELLRELNSAADGTQQVVREPMHGAHSDAIGQNGSRWQLRLNMPWSTWAQARVYAEQIMNAFEMHDHHGTLTIHPNTAFSRIDVSVASHTHTPRRPKTAPSATTEHLPPPPPGLTKKDFLLIYHLRLLASERS